MRILSPRPAPIPRRGPTVLAGSAAGIVAFCVSHGVPMAQVTALTGLEVADLIDPDARVPEQVLPPLWRLAAEALPGEPVGLALAEAAPFSFFGAVAHAARYAGDLRAAIGLFQRFSAVLSSQMRLRFVEGPRLAALELSHPFDAIDDGMGAELVAAMACRYVREVLGLPEAIAAVAFAFAQKGPLARYEAVLGVDVRFAQPATAVLIRSPLLDRPLPQRDPALFLFIQRHLDRALSALDPGLEPEALRQIRAAIARNAERGEYGAEALARSLGQSLRSLQRRARAHGVELRALLEQARETNARALLGDPSLSVDEVAFLLGYANEAAFRRAFRRWTGDTPAGFRRGAASPQP